MAAKLIHFVETPVFTKLIDRLGKPDSVDVLTALQDDLIENPKRGDVIKGSGGARKARVGNPKKKQGKSGGYRYIYYYFDGQSRIYLLLFYGKSEQADLTKEQLNIVAGYIKKAKEAAKGGK